MDWVPSAIDVVSADLQPDAALQLVQQFVKQSGWSSWLVLIKLQWVEKARRNLANAVSYVFARPMGKANSSAKVAHCEHEQLKV